MKEISFLFDASYEAGGVSKNDILYIKYKDFQMKAKEFKYNGNKLKVVFLTVVGSQLHKLNLENSDVDLKGVFLWSHETTFGLNVPQDVLEYKNTDKVEWQNLVDEVNKEFDLNLEADDDFTLFEARKFMQSALKNDSNMLDMLYSKETPVFCDDTFKEVLENKEVFLDTKLAKSRFLGMANGGLKLGKKTNDNKLLSKVLQSLFTLKLFLTEQTYLPVLPKEMREKVLEVKRGEKEVSYVEETAAKLEEELLNLLENVVLLESDTLQVNEMLVKLNLNY